jgi:hypothetical protein
LRHFIRDLFCAADTKQYAIPELRSCELQANGIILIPKNPLLYLTNLLPVRIIEAVGVDSGWLQAMPFAR